MTDYRSISLWMDTVGDDLTPRPPLSSDIDVDVAIVGAGYTGLWTAYYLADADPTLRIALVERDIAGYGASGRNGGWCSALFAASHAKIARSHGRDDALAMKRVMVATLDEIEVAITQEGIDCHFDRAGTLTLATSPTHVGRIKDSVNEERSWGSTEEDHRWLSADEASAIVDVQGCLGAAFTPHCAAIHPARLARGLARAIERRGVTIYEQTAATALGPGRIETTRGTVKAPHVVRATEGYTPALDGHRRTLAPIYSLMIATEPLP
ncbi:MAG: NAD(P)/FAD-dependent oxidoreductase, partial [Actinomycetota bacterium]